MCRIDGDLGSVYWQKCNLIFKIMILFEKMLYFCCIRMNHSYLQREQVPFLGGHHVVPPYFCSSPEWTNQTLVLEKVFLLFFLQVKLLKTVFQHLQLRNPYIFLMREHSISTSVNLKPLDISMETIGKFSALYRGVFSWLKSASPTSWRHRFLHTRPLTSARCVYYVYSTAHHSEDM